MSRGRVALGRDQNLGGYRRIFEFEDGLEVDENNLIEIERTRVYFDDVVGITYHRQVSVALVIGMSLLTLLFFGIAAIVGTSGESEGALIVGSLGLPFLLVLVLHLAVKIDVVTVYGKRTMARLRFSFRKGRARAIYRDLSEKVRAKQAKIAAELPPPAAPPEPPLPPAPPPPAPL